VARIDREQIGARDPSPVVGQPLLSSELNPALFEVFAKKKQPAVERFTVPRIATTVTPNGFRLVPEAASLNGRPDCRFRVLNPGGNQRVIGVCFAGYLVTCIDQQRKSPLRIASLFWALCAQVHLARYLREAGDYPSIGQLTIADLSDDEMLLAVHWRD
jgi:hypothetical protein